MKYKAVSKKTYIFGIELVAIVICLISFVLPKSHYSYEGSELESPSGIFMDSMMDVTEPGFYIDNSVAESGAEGVVVTPATNLRFGSYNVTLKYLASNTGNSYSCVSDWNTMPVTLGRTKDGLDRNDNTGKPMVITLNSALNVGGYQVQYNFSGDGYLYVYGLEIQETNWWKVYLLLVVICLSLIVNVCTAITESNDNRLKGDAVLVVLLTFFASLPLFDPYLMWGHDLGFHLGRIEALAESFRNGQIPSRVSSYWLDGKGYAASIFYGDLFLVIPALLRLLGSSVQFAYKIYIFLINLATACVSLFCFRRVFGMWNFGKNSTDGITEGKVSGRSQLAAIVATVIFVLSPYRLVCLYTRAAVGEYTAIVFYPLVFWGLMRLYEGANAESSDEKAKVGFLPGVAGLIGRTLPLILGVTGITNCHVLSGVILALFIIGFALINFRKTFTKRVLGEYGFTAVTVLLINLWYIVPFVQVMLDGIGAMGLRQNGRFRSNGTYLWQMLSLFPRTGISLSSEEIIGVARTEEMVVTIGAGVIVLGAYALMRAYALLSIEMIGNTDENRSKNKRIGIADKLFVVSLITLLMASPYFPWDGIKRISSVTNSIVTNIQFPFRFLSVAVLCIALLTGLMIELWPENIGSFKAIFSMAIVMMCIVSASYYYTNRGTTDDYTIIADDFNDDTIMGAEYLPSGTAVDYDSNYNETSSDTAVVNGWRREKGKIYVNVSNPSSDIAEISVPFIYYRGYRAKDVVTNGAVEVVKNNDGFANLRVGGGYNGEVCVFYKEPLLWRISEIISIIGFVGLMCFWRRFNAR
ncbi:hypothetical protein [Butyrivibrio sp. VCB2006]|uniref:hypothetical protein n=1 Tax=Butyrivibrio sp. VCB2006 TaxID=1280679 RepID=UPI0004929D94|nr:hypothetical protein [Butyrivibrio sp. VCB2006]